MNKKGFIVVNIFILLFFVAIIVTVLFLIKPSLTQFRNKTALSRTTIAIVGTVLSLIFLFIVGTLSPTPPKPAADESIPEHTAPAKDEKSVAEKTAEADKARLEFQDQNKKQLEALRNEDRPQFEVPGVDYTSPVAKVDLSNDQEIIAAVGLPEVEKEKGANQNGEPMTTYYFSDDLQNGLEISLSREFVDVAWKYDAQNPNKANAAFEVGQQITRALLGGKDGADLYDKISKGNKIDSLILKDGTEIKNARCGAMVCRYQVVR